MKDSHSKGPHDAGQATKTYNHKSLSAKPKNFPKGKASAPKGDKE